MFFYILDSNDFHHHLWMAGGFPLLMVILFIVGAMVVTLLVWIVLNAPRWRPERQYNEKASHVHLTISNLHRIEISNRSVNPG